MVDDDSVGYYLLIVVPITIYILYFIYIYCKYGRAVMQRHHRYEKAQAA